VITHPGLFRRGVPSNPATETTCQNRIKNPQMIGGCLQVFLVFKNYGGPSIHRNHSIIRGQPSGRPHRMMERAVEEGLFHSGALQVPNHSSHPCLSGPLPFPSLPLVGGTGDIHPQPTGCVRLAIFMYLGFNGPNFLPSVAVLNSRRDSSFRLLSGMIPETAIPDT